MSRSRKHQPICGHGTGSEKKDKQLANRRLRRLIKQFVNTKEVLPLLREISEPWTWAKDGKSYFGWDYIKYLRK